MISIIIPIYNSEKYLRECIDSVLKQNDFNDFELICVNDGSTDDSQGILDSYHDSRLIVLTQENQGAGVARNNGIDVAHGDYIMFLDSDDTMVSGNNIRMAYEYALCNDIDVLLCERNVIDENGTLLHTHHPNRSVLPCGIKQIFTPEEAGLGLFRIIINGPCAKLYKHSLITDNNLRFLSLRRSEDFPFVHIAMDLSKKLATFDTQLFNHRTNVTTSLEANKDKTPLIFHDAVMMYYQELRDRGLERFLPPAKVHSLGFLLYNLNMMKTFEGYQTVFNKIPELYNIYKIDVPKDSPVYDIYKELSKTIEEMITCGDAGKYLFKRNQVTEGIINGQRDTIVYLRKELNALCNRPFIRIYNNVSSFFHNIAR